MKQSVDNLLSRLRLWVLRGGEILILLISIVAPCGVVYMFGFPQTPVTLRYLEAGYQSLLILMWLAMTFRILLGDTSSDNNTRLNKRNRSILFGAYVVLTLIAIFNLALRYHWLAHDAFLNTVSAP